MCLESVAKQESGEQKSIEDSLDLLKVVGKTSKIFLSNGRESHDGIYQHPPTKQTQAMEILPWRKTSRIAEPVSSYWDAALITEWLVNLPHLTYSTKEIRPY